MELRNGFEQARTSTSNKHVVVFVSVPLIKECRAEYGVERPWRKIGRRLAIPWSSSHRLEETAYQRGKKKNGTTSHVMAAKGSRKSVIVTVSSGSWCYKQRRGEQIAVNLCTLNLSVK